MKKKTVYYIVSIILLLIVYYYQDNYLPKESSGTCSGNFNATVREVVDGDTIEVNECNKAIRLALVNTPERRQTNYTAAKEFTSNLCFAGSRIQVDQDDKQKKDRYGRIVGVVYCQDKNLNQELVENSLARILTEYCSRSEFADEEWAKGC